MANDRLINHTQGAEIIAQLTAINATLVRIVVALEPAQEPEQEVEQNGNGS